jgi:hypothetical protein
LLLRHDLIPIQLWIAFIDGTAALTVLHEFAGTELLEAFEIAEEWPLPRENICWAQSTTERASPWL